MSITPKTQVTASEMQLFNIIHDLLLSQKYDEAVMDGMYPSKHPAPHAQRNARASLRNAGIRVKSIWPKGHGPGEVDFSYWDKDAAAHVRKFNREQGKAFGKISSSRFLGNPEGTKIYIDVESIGCGGICSSLVPGERITLVDVQDFIARVSESRKVSTR